MGKLLNWKHSRLRFYLKNFLWNYKFWLYAKPIYGIKKYRVPIQNLEDKLHEEFDYYYDEYSTKYEIKETKRFLGYQYKGVIYLDNMGMQGIDEETWKAWIKKGLVKI